MTVVDRDRFREAKFCLFGGLYVLATGLLIWLPPSWRSDVAIQIAQSAAFVLIGVLFIDRAIRCAREALRHEPDREPSGQSDAS